MQWNVVGVSESGVGVWLQFGDIFLDFEIEAQIFVRFAHFW